MTKSRTEETLLDLLGLRSPGSVLDDRPDQRSIGLSRSIIEAGAAFERERARQKCRQQGGQPCPE